MNRHVEVIRLEGIGHVSKCLEGVAPAGLLKSKSNSGFTTFLLKKLKRQLVKMPYVTSNIIAVWVLKMISSQEVRCLQITCARHLGHLQSPLGTSWRGGIRQKV